MSLSSHSIPSMHNGVSQQSSLVRSPDQAEAVENAWLSIADGTGKRPPTESVARLLYTAPEGALIHEINRDARERYNVIVADGRLRVFDMNGVEQVVEAPGGWAYLASATLPAEHVSLTSVADYTFVTNRNTVCEMWTDDTTPPPGYYVWLNRTFGQDGQEITFGPGVAYQYAPNPVNPPITGTLQSFTKLPDTAPNGATYRIAGTDDTSFKNYYVRRNGAVWDETYKPGAVNGINAATMPHALVRQSDGTFVFAPFSWAPRRVGDEDTNPNPAFIGRTIRKLFVYQNRLAMITDESVVMSCVGDLGNFWRNTVLDYLESDVLEAAATATQVSLLLDVVVFNDGLLLTSDQTQFSLGNGEDGVTATSIAIRPVTSYVVAPRAGMVSLATEAYFVTEGSQYASIREYTRIDGEDAVTAADITAHCPAYIPKGVHKLVPMADKSALAVLTDGDPSAVYVYQFYWVSAAEKRQSAFHRWDLGAGATVLSASYLGGFLNLVVKRFDGVYLERMNMQGRTPAPHVNHECLLDRRAVVSGEFSPASQRTTVQLPYQPRRSEFRLVRTNASGKPLSVVDPTTYEWDGADRVYLPGDEAAGPLLAGETYTFRYTFSPLHIRRQDGTAITNGRTQVRTFTISYRDTGYFKTEVAPYGADPHVEEVLPSKLAQFTGKVLGARDLIINSPAFHTGDYAFTILAEAAVARISLVNDTHVASYFVSAEWEAFYWSRARG